MARPRATIALAAIAVTIASLGIHRIEVNSAFRSWFDADAPVIAADNAIRAGFTGTSTIRVLIEGDEPDALLDPQVLRGMVALQHSFREEQAITSTVSLADYVQVMNRAMNDGAPEAYAVPDSREAGSGLNFKPKPASAPNASAASMVISRSAVSTSAGCSQTLS